MKSFKEEMQEIEQIVTDSAPQYVLFTNDPYQGYDVLAIGTREHLVKQVLKRTTLANNEGVATMSIHEVETALKLDDTELFVMDDLSVRIMKRSDLTNMMTAYMYFMKDK